MWSGAGSSSGPAYSWRAESNESHGYMGYAVASAGDVNGDGYADLIVGAGMALQYGIIREIEVVNCDSIKEIVKLGFSPNSLQTTWIYSVGQIDAIVAQYVADLPNVASGTKEVSRSDGTPYSPEMLNLSW